MSTAKITKEVNKYYSKKIKLHGPTPKGVDWNSFESQYLRFSQLLKNFENTNKKFTILDYGCGFGSLINFLNDKKLKFEYTGFDIAESMLEEAKKMYPDNRFKWINNIEQLKKYDLVVASGIFNVKLKTSKKDWKEYILKTIDLFNKISIKEFSFNVLTEYSDKEYMKNYLHYASPTDLFDFCKLNYSKYVALDHDYPLYEFTIHVKKI